MTSILFLTKPRDPICRAAIEFLKSNFDAVDVDYMQRGAPFLYPNWRGDWLISYLCRNVVPEAMLNNAERGAINFHPAPPEYPGAGSLNIALYNGDRTFGITCHHMVRQVDSGPIIAVSRFPIMQRDSVKTLTTRAHVYQFGLFLYIMQMIIAGHELPNSAETWTREPYRLADFHALRRITLDMSEAEIRRRIRATEYPGGDLPYIEVVGRRFGLVIDD